MSETNKLRALLMAAVMVTSVFAGVGAVSAVESGTATANDVAIGQSSVNQTVAFDTNVSASSTEAITISPNSTLNATINSVSASATGNDSVSVENATFDGNTVSVNLTNTNTSAANVSVSVEIDYDTTGVESSAVGNNYGYNIDGPDGSSAVAAFTFTEDTTDTGGDTNTTDNNVETINDGGLAFQGETVAVDVSSLNPETNDIVLREGTGDDTSFVTELNPENGVVEIDTSDLEGSYVVTNGSGEGISFEVAVQNLQANWSDESIDQGDSAQLELDSNRNGYFVEVSADNLDADELETIFEGSDAYVSTDTENDSVYLDAGVTENIQANLGDVQSGNYNFNVEVNDTTASDTASLEVTETSTDVNFAQSVYSEQVGDKVEMSVEMQDASEAVVFVGSEDVNYLEAVRVVDENEDGVVNFTFNTYTASESDTNPFEAQGEDSVEEVTLDSEVDGSLDSRIEPGDYNLRVASSDTYYASNDTVADEQDIATLDLTERNTSGISVWTAPGDNDEYDSVEELLQNVNQSSTVADGDQLVLQVNASGVSGIVDEDDISSITGTEGINLTIEEADVGANAEANTLNLSNADAQIYQNQSAAEDQFFVVINTEGEDFFDNEEYTAAFTVGDESESNSPIDYVADGEEERVETTFTIEDPQAQFQLNDDDRYEVAKSQNAQVQFDTNLASGSEVTIRMRSAESGSAFLLSNTVEVGADGTATTTFDTSNVDVGTEFDIIVRSGGQNLASEEGVIVEGQNGTGTAGTVTDDGATVTDDGATVTDDGATPTDDGATPTDDGATPTDGNGETTTGSTDGGTPGFGVVVAVTALLAAALLAVRRD